MKSILILTFCLLSSSLLNAQGKMIINAPFNGNTHYGGFSMHIDSISEIPTIIQSNVNGYLKQILGSMSDSLVFSHGQVIDLKEKFKQDSTVYRYEWIVPTYDLNFILRDNSIGIKKFYLQIHLDEYGQIIYSNWPRKHYSDKSEFKSLTDIEKFAILHAGLNGCHSDKYSVSLKYNEKFDKVCWAFKFPIKMNAYKKEYYVLEIDWKWVGVVDEYNQVTPLVR